MDMTQDIIPLTEELYFQNDTATLFHRTRLELDKISQILNSGWSDSGSGLYGRGIYTTYKIDQQFTGKMSGYGDRLLKFKRTTLKNIIFFSEKLAKKVHPDGPSLKDQFNKIYPKHRITDAEFEDYQKQVESSVYSADVAKRVYDDHPDIAMHVPGIEYFGRQDGPCMLIYPPAKDTILLAAANVSGTEKIDFDDIPWISVGGARQVSQKAFDSGLYGVPKHVLQLNLKKLDKSSFQIFKRITSKEKWSLEDMKSLVQTLNPTFAFNIISNNEHKFPNPYDIDYTLLIEMIAINQNSKLLTKIIKHVVDSKLLDERQKNIFVSRLHHHAINIPQLPPLNLEDINELINLASQYPSVVGFYSYAVLLFTRSNVFNNVSDHISTFNRFEQIKQGGLNLKTTVAYNSFKSLSSVYLIRLIQNGTIFNQIISHIQNTYKNYGLSIYFKFVDTLLQDSPNIEFLKLIVSILDGPSHDQLDPSFFAAFESSKTQYRRYIADYLISFKFNQLKTDSHLFIIKTYVDDNAADNLQNYLQKLEPKTGEILSSVLKQSSSELMTRFLNLNSEFTKYIPDIDGFDLADYLRKSDGATFQRNVNGVINAFSTKRLLSFSDLSGIVFAADSKNELFNIFIDKVFPDLYSKKSLFEQNVFDLENVIFLATDSVQRQYESIPRLIQEFYKVAPNEFTVYKNAADGPKWFSDTIGLLSEGLDRNAIMVGITLLSDPISLFPPSKLDPKLINLFLNSVSQRSLTFGLLSQIVNDDNMFIPKKEDNDEVNSILMILFSSPLSNETLIKIKKFNPTFFETIDDSNLIKITGDIGSTLRNTVRPEGTDKLSWDGYLIQNLRSIFDQLKKNPNLSNIDTFVAFYLKTLRVSSNPEKFVEFVKFLVDWKGASLGIRNINTIVGSLDQTDYKTKRELLYNNKGLSEVIFTILGDLLRFANDPVFKFVYRFSVNKMFILSKYLESREESADSNIVSDMYDYTPDNLKGEFVKKIYADNKVVFDADLTGKLLASTQTPQTAELLLNRTDLDNWKVWQILELFRYNDSIKSTGVKTYVYKRLAKYFPKFTEDDSQDFIFGLYSFNSLLFFLANKPNITKNSIYVLFNKALSDDISKDNVFSRTESIAKVINRYHNPMVMTWFIEAANSSAASSVYYSTSYDDLYLKILDLQKNRISPFTVREMLNGISRETKDVNDKLFKYVISFATSLIKNNGSNINPDIIEQVLNYTSKRLTSKNKFKEILNLFLTATKPNLNDRLVYLFMDTLNASADSDQSYEVAKQIIRSVGPSITTSMIHNIITKGIDPTHDIKFQNKELVTKIINLKNNKLTRDDIKTLVLGSNDPKDTVNKVKDYVDNNWLKQLASVYRIPVDESLIKYSDYYNIMNEDKKQAYQMDLNQAFDVFDQSYKKATGKSWDKQKFISRAQSWTFFGDDAGYVAVREQRGGMVKLVGVAGNPKSVLRGFREMTAEYAGKSIWGAVSSDIADMTIRIDPNFKKLTVPSGMVGKLMFNAIKAIIPPQVFGGAVIKQVNADGTITFDYPDVGETNKVLLGNTEYFDFLKTQVLSDPRIAPYKNIIQKLF